MCDMRPIAGIMLATMLITAPALAWEGPFNVSGDFNPDGGDFFPDMAADAQGNLHFVWCDLISDNWNIRHRMRYPNSTWSGVTRVSEGMNDAYWVRCAMDAQNNLHVAWHSGSSQSGTEIYYRKRFSNGAWGPVVNVSNSGGVASLYPDIAADGQGHVFVVWHENIADGDKNWEVALARFDGAIWLPYERVTTSSRFDVYPVVACDASDTLHLAWTSYDEVFYKARSSAGAWSGETNISRNSGSSRDPHISVSSSGVPHVVWHDNTPGDWEYYYATKSGGTWVNPVNLSNNPAATDCYGAVAASPDGSVQVVWQDYQRVYYTRNAGAGFGTPVLLYTSSYNTKHAMVYVDAGADAHIAWQNKPSGQDWDVLYMKKGYPDLTPPSEVNGLTVTPGSTLARLSWTNPSELDYVGTMVRFKITGYPSGPSDGTLLHNQPSGRGSTGSLTHQPLSNGTTYYYAVFTYDDSGNHSSGVRAEATPSGPADFDRDGDVDQVDFGAFQRCYSGAFVPQETQSCSPAILDGDTDVDGDDFAVFANCMEGPGVTADPQCAAQSKEDG